MNDDLFRLFVFSSFAYIFQDITMSWPAVLFLETAGHAIIRRNRKKKILTFFFENFDTTGVMNFFLQFFKKKKFLSNQNCKDADR